MTKQSERQRLWRERIKAYEASGMTVAAWCAEQKLSTDQLYYWKRKFNDSQAPVKQTPAEPSGWLPVAMDTGEDSNGSSALSIRIGHATVEVRTGFDRNLLAEVAKVLVTLC
jgi:hypothetical protein